MATIIEPNVIQGPTSSVLSPLYRQTQNKRKRSWQDCRAVEIRVKNIESVIVEG